ncbi:MAG: sulfite exporter TauE/SafE family protein [Deltaproteobacteria bacterium]|nr:sulfite exporter TauE/SafE family protein [Deltaproteobacteria bacterium]
MSHMLIIFLAGFLASMFGTLIGGSSLVTIPTLLLLGCPPHTAIGTDRFGIMGVCSAGWYQFHRKKMIDYRIGLTMTIPVIIGSFLGARLCMEIGEVVLKWIIIGVSLFCLAFLLWSPDLGVKSGQRSAGRSKYFVGVFLTFGVGVYVGIYGAMGGTLLMYILILWFGQTFLESAGTIKIAAFFMNASAAIVFGYNGAIAYNLAFPMFCGCFIGSSIGAYYSDRIGNVWIKRFFIVLLLILILKLML